MPGKLTPEERRDAIERALVGNPTLTLKQLAERFGVDAKTIQRDRAEMRKQMRVLSKEIPYSAPARDAVYEAVQRSQDLINETVQRARTMATMLEKQIEEWRDGEPCDCCGRKGSRVNGLELQAYAKLLDSIKGHVELRAKIDGEYTDNPIININQIDSDLELFLGYMNRLKNIGAELVETLPREVLEEFPELRAKIQSIGPTLARQMYYDLKVQSERRSRRLPEFVQIIDALPPPSGAKTVSSRAESSEDFE